MFSENTQELRAHSCVFFYQNSSGTALISNVDWSKRLSPVQPITFVPGTWTFTQYIPFLLSHAFARISQYCPATLYVPSSS